MESILKYFPDLKPDQIEKLGKLKGLYEEWNQKINVISRKDMDDFYEHHVLHSLGVAKVAPFEFGARILDVGTGGGFPGIPLAIIFPHCHFTLVDSIGKKIKVVQAVSEALELENVIARQERAENLKETFDHVVSRAVTRLPVFKEWVKGKIEKTPRNARLPHSIWYLKGGDLSEELAPLRHYKIHPLKDYFHEEFFETKVVVQV